MTFALFVQPAIQQLLSLQGKANSFVSTASALALFVVWERASNTIQGKIGRILRLDFLDPYVGNRVKRTIRIFKGETEESLDA
ncbi:MAG TPA: hypothetical protein VJ813_19030 [Vicinamibacterales bacterium]|nr:hypothetical protein [Vicinamibacterales bacterium]